MWALVTSVLFTPDGVFYFYNRSIAVIMAAPSLACVLTLAAAAGTHCASLRAPLLRVPLPEPVAPRARSPVALHSALELRGGLSKKTTSRIAAWYVGFPGVALLTSPDFFFGPEGMLPYYLSPAGPVGTAFGRALGGMMTACGLCLCLCTNEDAEPLLRLVLVAAVSAVPQL